MMLATSPFAVPILRTLPFFCTTRIWAHVKLDCTCSGSQVHYRVSQIQMKQQIKKASVALISLTIASPYIPNMLEQDPELKIYKLLAKEPVNKKRSNNEKPRFMFSSLGEVNRALGLSQCHRLRLIQVTT